MEDALQSSDAPLSFLDERQNRFVKIQRSTGKRMDELMSELCRIGPATEGGLQEAVIQRYGLDRGDAGFLLDLAREADAEAVDRDKQALKEAFTYRDHGYDLWEVLFADPDRPFFAPLRIVELPPFAAEGFVEECYYEKGALEPLARKYGGFDKWAPEAFQRLLARLEEQESFDAMERLCTSVARRARSRFFAEQAGRNGKAGDAWLERFKEYALQAYDEAIAWLERIGRAEAAGRLAEQRQAVSKGRLTELPAVSDLRRMDEAVFWELICRAGSGAETVDDRLEALERMLGAFRAPDIKRFGALYAGFMRKLHHWNVWALAYAARDGCSDDSFMAFRTWLILEGDPALVELAVADPAQAARRVPRDPELPDGTLLSMIEEAFLRRKGAPTEMPMIDNPSPKGREWAEDQLERAYPELVLYYGSVEAWRTAS